MLHGPPRPRRHSRLAAPRDAARQRTARTFFGDDDYALYRDLLAASCRAAEVEIWAWCLMPNHVHLILVPSDADGLRRALAPVHRRYAGVIHARRKRTGHFWQGRFGCVAMDEAHLAAALRYVSLNPVRRASSTARATGAGPVCARISRPRRRRHDARAGSRALSGFREFPVRRSRCRHDRAAPPRRDHRPSARRSQIPRRRRAEDTACSQAGQAWAEAACRRGLSALSP